MSESTQSLDPDEQASRFLKDLCRHVVCLTGTLVALDSAGNPTGSEQFFNYSGFVISAFGRWLFVTAGHVFQKLDGHIRRGELKIIHCNLTDYYGLDVNSGLGVPFNYCDTAKYYVDDDSLGLDIGIICLSPHYARLLTANRIQAIPQDGWEQNQSLKFDQYGLLGFADEHTEKQRRVSPSGATIIGGVRASLLFGTATDAIPVNKPIPETPWFAIELKDKTRVNSIVGMSGGPILGFQNRSGKPPLYTAVAVQSWWDKDRRIAFGTRLSAFMSRLEMEMRTILAEQEESAGQ